MPFHQAFGNADGKELALANGPEKDLLVKHKGRPIIIVGNPNNDPPTVRENKKITKVSSYFLF